MAGSVYTCVALFDDGCVPMNPLQPGDPGQIGAYRLLGRLGEGGMGQVFLGRSPGGRRVAVKLIRPEHADRAAFRARFAREVEAAKRVGGFHTAPVVDADPDADPPWMVTAYIPGPSLTEVISDHGSLSGEQARALATGLAEGLSAIHACGLVHRDLKPANVIMADDGPRIIDFGIARVLDDHGLTDTGAVLGTYSYMSPEQVRGNVAGPASDVFSLGAVLAHAATGTPPFGSGSVAVIVHNLINAPPNLDGLPADPELTEVIIACLAKDPADRPAVADILTRLTLLNTTTQPSPDARTPADRTEHRVAAPEGDQSRFTNEHTVADDRSGQPSMAPPAQWRTLIRRRTVLLAGFGGLAATAIPTGVVLWRGFHNGHGDQVGSVAFSPDGKTLASGSLDATIRLWNVATGDTVKIFKTGTNFGIGAVAFSPDGQTLASSGGDGRVRLWNLATGRDTRLPLPGAPIQSLSFSPDGRILVLPASREIWLWDVAAGRSIRTLTGHADYVDSVAFSHDGKTLASGSRDTTLRLWNVATGKPAKILPGLARGVSSVAFSPDGKTVAGTGENNIRLWDAASGDPVKTLTGHTALVFCLAFSPDGKMLASGGDDGTVLLQNPASGNVITALTGYDGSVISLAFSPDSRILATGTNKGSVRLQKLT